MFVYIVLHVIVVVVVVVGSFVFLGCVPIHLSEFLVSIKILFSRTKKNKFVEKKVC